MVHDGIPDGDDESRCARNEPQAEFGAFSATVGAMRMFLRIARGMNRRWLADPSTEAWTDPRRCIGIRPHPGKPDTG